MMEADAEQSINVGIATTKVLLDPLQNNLETDLEFSTNVSFVDKGGLVLNNVELQIIFWGSSWSSNPNPSVISVNNAVNSIVSGPYMFGLSQYRNIESGTIVGTVLVTSAIGTSMANPPNPLSQRNVETLISDLITAGMIPDPGTNSQLLYCVIASIGAQSVNTSTAGWHTYFVRNSQNVHYMCVTNNGSLDHITAVFSHELAESCTNPENTAFVGVPGTCSQPGWCEISDVCEGIVGLVNGILVQSYWSQRDGSCIILKDHSIATS